jgi:hypothetical protein
VEDRRFSITCVVEMFTTAGSTLFTIDANELEEGIASGMGSSAAPLPANAMDFMADVRPETNVPIRIPKTSVSATNSPATIFSRRAQLTILLTGSPILCCSSILSAACPAQSRTHRSSDYNIRNIAKLPGATAAPENTLAFRPGGIWRFDCSSSSLSLTRQPANLLSAILDFRNSIDNPLFPCHLYMCRLLRRNVAI